MKIEMIPNKMKKKKKMQKNDIIDSKGKKSKRKETKKNIDNNQNESNGEIKEENDKMKIDLEKEYKNKKDYQIYTSARNKEVKEITEDNPPKVSSLSRRESKKEKL